MKLDALSVTSRNFTRTVAFYELLGFAFSAYAADTKHLEPISKDGDVRLMIDNITS